MPLPQVIARLNKRYTNRLVEPWVSRLPGYLVVAHSGRHSGASYSTPLYGFESDQGLLVVLTYGAGADWAQNVMEGGGTVSYGGVERLIAQTTVVTRSTAWHHLPVGVRAALRLMRVTEFMQLILEP